MALAQRVGNDYINVHIEGGARAILGNVYGQSSDERALAAILESLRYEGMTDRRDTVAEAQNGTFDWTFLEGKTEIVTRRWIDRKGVSQEYSEAVQMSFKAWLETDDEGLFCVMGKPGSGKSTFMCVHPRVT
jgi:dephospho-CoA kinase